MRALWLLLTAVSCGSTSNDAATSADAASDGLSEADDSGDGSQSDGDAGIEVGPDAGDGDVDPFGVCADSGTVAIPKKWRVTCCGGQVCQGTCENGACMCGNVVGGCQHLKCCDVAGGSDEILVCGGTGVCESFQ